MPVPPILDVYVVWHPHDPEGQVAFDRLHAHFHSATYSGLAGGAVEVYPRSAGWARVGGPPRPMALPGSPVDRLEPAHFVAVIPVMGSELVEAVLADRGWRDYLEAAAAHPREVMLLLPLPVDGVDASDTVLESVLTGPQRLSAGWQDEAGLLERDLAQVVAQLASSSDERIEVFISHTKGISEVEKRRHEEVPPHERVRAVIANTRLGSFFDASNIQTGDDWRAALRDKASRCAMLMVRTDTYAGRNWTQEEVLLAKQADVPIVCLSTLTEGEQRGSFLMDHVPTVPWDKEHPAVGIRRAIGQLVDEALKRALWLAQSSYNDEQGFDWQPVHAPEPVTAIRWLREHRAEDPDDPHLWIIHPDPPLGRHERVVTDELCRLARFGMADGNAGSSETRIDILTPRSFAARGGRLRR